MPTTWNYRIFFDPAEVEDGPFFLVECYYDGDDRQSRRPVACTDANHFLGAGTLSELKQITDMLQSAFTENILTAADFPAGGDMQLGEADWDEGSDEP